MCTIYYIKPNSMCLACINRNCAPSHTLLWQCQIRAVQIKLNVFQWRLMFVSHLHDCYIMPNNDIPMCARLEWNSCHAPFVASAQYRTKKHIGNIFNMTPLNYYIGQFLLLRAGSFFGVLKEAK